MSKDRRVRPPEGKTPGAEGVGKNWPVTLQGRTRLQKQFWMSSFTNQSCLKEGRLRICSKRGSEKEGGVGKRQLYGRRLMIKRNFSSDLYVVKAEAAGQW